MCVFLYMYLSKSWQKNHAFERSCLEALQAVLGFKASSLLEINFYAYSDVLSTVRS